MAKPRIFLSSTCYDLSEVRHQLKDFIETFGYEAVLSEFGNIFFSYDKHVQDGCLSEISYCHLFVLVIGNSYGSNYHIKDESQPIPDSVTLKEFKKALQQKIYKHIFVNKFVYHDYRNYKTAIEKATITFFHNNNVPVDQVEAQKVKLRVDFDSKYPFAHQSYIGLFYFLDIISDLTHNNAITTFETCSEIKESLRKQWAHFMHDCLTIKNVIPINENNIDDKKNNVFRLLDIPTAQANSTTQSESINFFDARTLAALNELQDKIEICFDDIFGYKVTDSCNNVWVGAKVGFSEKINLPEAENWLAYIKTTLQSYKWTKRIKTEIVFKNLPVINESLVNTEIAYKSLFELYCEYDALGSSDKESFLVILTEKINCFYSVWDKDRTIS